MSICLLLFNFGFAVYIYYLMVKYLFKWEILDSPILHFLKGIMFLACIPSFVVIVGGYSCYATDVYANMSNFHSSRNWRNIWKDA